MAACNPPQFRYVTKGAITRNDKMRLVRDGTVVYEGTFATLRRSTGFRSFLNGGAISISISSSCG